MSATPSWKMTAAELAAAFRSGETDPIKALDDVLERIEAVNPQINAFVAVDLQGARIAAVESAARFEAGHPIGALDGIPTSVKDNLYVGGLPATWGSHLYADYVAPRDDLAVARLREAGAVILGKTNTPELALGGSTNNLLFGSTGNPWDLELSPGGSSGGAAAAIAAGCGPLAVGTDAGGSIRRPAGHTGIAGLKPGVGRVPRRYGFPPLAHDLQVVGPMARSVADLRLVFELIATPAAKGTLSLRRPLKIGFIASAGEVMVEPYVSAAFATSCEILRDLGHDLVEISPLWKTDEVAALFMSLSSAGVARVMADHDGWETKVTPAIRSQGEVGKQRSAADYVVDLDRVSAFRAEMHDALDLYDVIVTPAAPVLPWPRNDPGPKTIAGKPAGPRDASAFSTAVNIAGLPAIVVPMPVTGLPAGIQMIGPMLSEELLLNLASSFEKASPWPRLAPL